MFFLTLTPYEKVLIEFRMHRKYFSICFVFIKKYVAMEKYSIKSFFQQGPKKIAFLILLQKNYSYDLLFLRGTSKLFIYWLRSMFYVVTLLQNEFLVKNHERIMQISRTMQFLYMQCQLKHGKRSRNS